MVEGDGAGVEADEEEVGVGVDEAAAAVAASHDPLVVVVVVTPVRLEVAAPPVVVAIFQVRRVGLVPQEVRARREAICHGHRAAGIGRPNFHPEAGLAQVLGAFLPVEEIVPPGVTVRPSAVEAARRNFLPAIVRVEEIVRLSSQIGPVAMVAGWLAAVVHHDRAPETVLALKEEWPTGPRSFPTSPAAALQIAPELEPAIGPARATLVISLALPAGPVLVPHLAVVSPTGPRNCLPIDQALVVIAPAWETVRAQGSGRNRPSNGQTGASGPRTATNNGNSAWTIVTTPGTSGRTVANSSATTSSRIAINAGTISRAHAKTVRTGAMKTARTGKIIVRICGDIAATAPRRFGTTRATFTTMCLMTVGGVPLDGEWDGLVTIR